MAMAGWRKRSRCVRSSPSQHDRIIRRGPPPLLVSECRFCDGSDIQPAAAHRVRRLYRFSMADPPPDAVLNAFGLFGTASPLIGGEGQSWSSGGFVFKPCVDPEEWAGSANSSQPLPRMTDTSPRGRVRASPEKVTL